MNEILNSYLEKPAEIVFEWNDLETGAQAWLVINSLKNGAAGGGTRMRLGLSKDEVVSLAKVMELKFAVCGPLIGGAKSGINFDPRDPRKKEVLKRWFIALRPILKSYYGTGGDLNVDEVKDVFPITEELGIIHPQEGVLEGHFKYDEVYKKKTLAQLDHGCKLPVVSDQFSVDRLGSYNVADMITGYGVSESINHYYQLIKNQDLKGKKVLIQGWGNVASAAAFYLSLRGASITAIIDKEFGIVEKDGLSLEEIRKLFIQKNGNSLSSDRMKPISEINDEIWSGNYNIFVPAAASRIVTLNQVKSLIDNGLECISCGANVPFIEDKIIFGNTSQSIDQAIALIPDFIANCGMARTFAYLMQKDILINEESIFKDVSDIIKMAILKLKTTDNEPNKLMNKFLSLYLKS